MANMKIKKGDTVVVLSGKDKGKQGKVQVVIPSDRKVVVEGVNIVTCHTKPRRQGENRRHRQARSRDLCEQGAGCLSQVLQGYPRCLQDRGRQEEPRLQALRRSSCRRRV